MRIHEDRCWNCGICVKICPTGAMELRALPHRERLIWNNRGTAEPFMKSI
ncbi:MAG: 4Fe-4S binding protein [Desulfomonile tiedjei]|uniref:4Fe-4S binding protein n=1 Tax=Desulfomonile tiedjei TaxID=2358 RepID=A0A9D6Z2J1_9BACT|nr:4Fe-4S binding protein [Desulfomonile tiedjei]